MNLSSLLSNISHDEVLEARKQSEHHSRQRNPLGAKEKRMMNRYPAMGVLMSLPLRPDHNLFTKEKLEGYKAACRLISTLAEVSGSAPLQRELASITDNEMLMVVEEMMSTEKMAFAEWFRSCGQNYYGYVLGMWEHFLDLLNSNRGDEGFGFLIVAGGLIHIAENREGTMPRSLTP